MTPQAFEVFEARASSKMFSWGTLRVMNEKWGLGEIGTASCVDVCIVLSVKSTLFCFFFEKWHNNNNNNKYVSAKLLLENLIIDMHYLTEML